MGQADRLVPPGTAWASTSRCFPHTPRVELCLFEDGGGREVIALPEYTDEVWHGCLLDARPRTVYGYRVRSPYEPAADHRFNPNKLLLDPYAKQMIGRIDWNPALFGYKAETGDDLTFDVGDRAPFMMKACGNRHGLHLPPRGAGACAVGEHDRL